MDIRYSFFWALDPVIKRINRFALRYIYRHFYLQSKDWKIRARGFRRQACDICYYCHKTHISEAMDVHHLNYENLGHEVYGVDVVVAGRSCHNAVENLKRGK